MPSALVVEPSAPVVGALRKFLEGGGIEVGVAASLEDALPRLSAGTLPSLVISSVSPTLDGELVCQQVHRVAPGVPVLLLYPPDVDDAMVRADAAGADAALVAPLKRANVLSAVRLLVSLREARAGGAGASASAPASAPPRAEPTLGPAHPDFAFLKRLLLTEVKRSRRYQYPVAILLVALDPGRQPLAQPTGTLSEVLGLISSSVREIDLAVLFTDNRFLVFMPHTGREGAQVAAGRLCERAREATSVNGLTVSVGVAAHEPGPETTQVSFGSLLKQAHEALRRAQAAGGNRVDVDGARARRERVNLT